MFNKTAAKILSKVESTPNSALQYDDFFDYFSNTQEDATEIQEKVNIRNMLKLGLTEKRHKIGAQQKISLPELLKKSSNILLRDQDECMQHELMLIERYKEQSEFVGDAIAAISKSLEEETDLEKKEQLNAKRLLLVRDDYTEHKALMDKIIADIFGEDSDEALELIETLLQNLFADHNKYLNINELCQSKRVLEKIMSTHLLEKHPSDTNKVRLMNSL